MGGKSGGTQAQSTTGPWEGQQEYLKGLYQAALAGTHGQFRDTSSPLSRLRTMGVPLGVQDWQGYLAQRDGTAAPGTGMNSAGTGILAQIAEAERQKKGLANQLYGNRLNPDSGTYQDLMAQYRDLTGENWTAPVTKQDFRDQGIPVSAAGRRNIGGR